MKKTLWKRRLTEIGVFLIIVSVFLLFAGLVIHSADGQMRTLAEEYHAELSYPAMLDDVMAMWEEIATLGVSLLLDDLTSQERAAHCTRGRSLCSSLRVLEKKMRFIDHGHGELRVNEGRRWEQENDKRNLYVPRNGELPRLQFSIEEIEEFFD